MVYCLHILNNIIANFAVSMRQIINIVMSLLLSATMIWVGAGLTVLHCCLAEYTKLVTLADAMDEHEDSMPDCLHANLLTLSPRLEASDADFDLQVPVFDLAPIMLIQYAELVFSVITEWLSGDYWWADPPREYLSLIRILRI